MAKPKMTTMELGEALIARCPHCEVQAWDASLTLADLIDAWPITGFVHVGDDGYAHSGDYLEVDCPSCAKPIAVTFGTDKHGEHLLKLIAARTDADKQLLGAPRCKLTMEMF